MANLKYDNRKRRYLTLCMLGNFSLSICRLNIFKNIYNISGTLSECQTVWIPIRAKALSVLIWVQTLCKENQQMKKVAASRQRVKRKEKEQHTLN